MNMKIALITALLFLTSSSLLAQWNQKDENGKRIGKWKQYYVNGKLRYTGQFKDGYPIGTFVYYNSAGSILSKLIYSENGSKANATLYYPDGKMKAQGIYINKKKHGTWSYYSQRTQKKTSEESYKEGIKHGMWRNFYTDGRLSSEINWKDGKRHGIFREFYNNGEPKTIATFFEGKFHGKFVAYHPHRIPMSQGNYVHGKKDGLWTSWNYKGKVKSKTHYNMGFIGKEEIFIKDLKTPTDSIGDPKSITPPPGVY